MAARADAVKANIITIARTRAISFFEFFMCSSLYISLVRAYGPARHFRAAAMGSTGTQHRVTAVFPCQIALRSPARVPKQDRGLYALAAGSQGMEPCFIQNRSRRIAYNILLWALTLRRLASRRLPVLLAPLLIGFASGFFSALRFSRWISNSA